jgi:hypothetical protein
VDLIGVALVYPGLGALALGAASIARPLRWLRIRSRRAGAAVAGAGILLVLAGVSLPAPLRRVEGPRQRLDEFAPAYQFHEVHETHVHAPPERVWAALRAVTAEEIRFFRTLTWIRSPRWPWSRSREDILAPPEEQPLLDVALRSGFLLLAEDVPREIVVGTVVCCRPVWIGTPEAYTALEQPGFAKATMSFALEDQGNGWTRLTTETRVHATDGVSRRRFAAYWRVIYPGSALIRRMWLAAIKARAEA